MKKVTRINNNLKSTTTHLHNIVHRSKDTKEIHIQKVKNEHVDKKQFDIASGKEANYKHWVHQISKSGSLVRLHMCMNSHHRMIPCAHVNVGFGYSRSLITAIMNELPKFVHKHTVIYKMFSTLKLYYLHQQELLNEILEILRNHIHSAQLAKTLTTYIASMQGGSYGWLTKLTTLLKSHVDMDTSKIKQLVNHQNLIWRLHTIIRNAAGRNAAQVEKLYEVMEKHGLIGKHSITHTNKMLVTESHKLLKKIKKVFRS